MFGEAGGVVYPQSTTGCPKNYWHLISKSIFFLILRISFILAKGYFYLDFEIKIAEIC